MGAMDYTTLVDLKAYLAISGTSDDGLLADLITAASRLIDDHCGRFFTPQAQTRLYDAIGDHIAGRTLYVDGDLLAVTTLTNGDGTIIDPAEFVLRPLNFMPAFGLSLKEASGLCWTYTSSPEGAISVAGTWGYGESVPEPVATAAIRLAAWLYQGRDAGGREARAVVFDVRGNPILPRLLPREVIDLLRPYIRLRIRG